MADTAHTSDNEDTGMRPRVLKPGQRTCVWIASTVSSEPTLLCETSDILLEAPNWSTDGSHLLLNGDGRLWRVNVAPGSTPVEVALDGVPEINNDHVLSPDGRTVYLSGMDGHLYSAPVAGGRGTRLTENDGTLHFLHGISPDGKTLAYVSVDRSVDGAPGRLALMPSAGGPGTLVDTGDGHIDGPEYSPDGAYLYLNTEAFASAPGHAQIGRLPAGGGPVEQVLATDGVDWFPHLSPDGRLAAYVEFPAGTLGHPENLEVAVHVVSVDDWSAPLRTFPLFGGQGTLNVNSWCPDSTRFAYVSYPVACAAQR